MIGPEQVAKRTAPLKNTGNELRTSNEKGGELYELNRLGPGLERAANGVSQIRSGLARAAAGAGLLSEGSGNAEEGALQIADGLGASDRRRRKAVKGIARSTTARANSNEGSGNRRRPGRGGARRRALVDSNWRDDWPTHPPGGAASRHGACARTERLGGDDPALAKAAERSAELVGLIDGVRDRSQDAPSDNAQSSTAARANAGRKATTSTTATKNCTTAPRELHEESTQLPTGLEELQDGQFGLANGINRPAGRLGNADSRTSPRASTAPTRCRPACSGPASGSPSGAGLADQEGRPDQHRVAGPLRLRLLRPLGDRRRAAGRTRAGRRSDRLNNGGQGAAITVISRYTFNTPGSKQPRPAAQGRRRGPRPRPPDVDSGRRRRRRRSSPTTDAITSARMPLVVIAITLVTLLVMIIIVRALLLAALAVGAQPGHGRRRLRRHRPPLQRPRRLAAGRPHLRRRDRGGGDVRRRLRPLDRLRGLPADADAGELRGEGDNEEAISFGLERTARVITGAAAIMMAVFIAFAGGADRHRQPARHRPDRRRPARRDRGPDRAAAGADAAARRPGLARAALARPDPAGTRRRGRGPRPHRGRRRRARRRLARRPTSAPTRSARSSREKNSGSCPGVTIASGYSRLNSFSSCSERR